MWRRSRIVLSGGLSAVMIGLIVWYCDLGPLASVLRSVGVSGGLLLFSIYLVTQSLRALRFWIRMPAEDRPSLLEMFAVVSIHQALNQTLPARLGELGFPFILRRYTSVTGARALSVLLMARISDLLSLTLMFMLSIALVSAAHNTALTRAPAVLSGVAVIVAVALLPLVIPWCISKSCGMLQRLPLRSPAFVSNRSRLIPVLENLQSELAAPVSFQRRFLFFVCSALVWLSIFLMCWVVMRRSGFPISYMDAVFGSSLASYANVLPINSAGSFGSMEAGWTLGFSLVGISARDALSTGFVLHILGMLFLGTTALPSWLFLRSRKRVAPGSA